MESITSSNLEAAVESELARLGVSAEIIKSEVFGTNEWSVTLKSEERTFEVGWVVHDGLWCWESTKGKTKDFLPPGVRITHEFDRLLHEALSTIRYAIDHPSYKNSGDQII